MARAGQGPTARHDVSPQDPWDPRVKVNWKGMIFWTLAFVAGFWLLMLVFVDVLRGAAG